MRALDGETVQSNDIDFAHPETGRKFWYVTTYGPLKDATGNITGVVANLHDITRRKQFERDLITAKDKAEELAKLKSTFLANMSVRGQHYMSHEIRTPLSGIIGFAQVMAEELPEDQKEFASLVESNGKRLLDTLNSVFDLAQLQSGSMRVDVERGEVASEIEDTIRLFGPLALRKGLILESDIPEPNVEALFDRKCLGRILNDLVSNAVKFTERGRVCL